MEEMEGKNRPKGKTPTDTDSKGPLKHNKKPEFSHEPSEKTELQ